MPNCYIVKETAASPQESIKPKAETWKNILNLSKAFEVKKSVSTEDVEIILN